MPYLLVCLSVPRKCNLRDLLFDMFEWKKCVAMRCIWKCILFWFFHWQHNSYLVFLCCLRETVIHCRNLKCVYTFMQLNSIYYHSGDAFYLVFISFRIHKVPILAIPVNERKKTNECSNQICLSVCLRLVAIYVLMTPTINAKETTKTTRQKTNHTFRNILNDCVILYLCLFVVTYVWYVCFVELKFNSTIFCVFCSFLDSGLLCILWSFDIQSIYGVPVQHPALFSASNIHN